MTSVFGELLATSFSTILIVHLVRLGFSPNFRGGFHPNPKAMRQFF